MGDTNRRTNITKTSARGSVATADGGLAVTCPEAGAAAVTRPDELYEGQQGTLATDGKAVWLFIDGRSITQLVPSEKTTRLVGCIERGFTYQATLRKRTVEFSIA